MTVSTGITLGKNARARSLAKFKNHTVILGWSKNLFTILSELEFANLKKPRVVLVAKLPTAQMQSEVEKQLPQLKRLKISYISAETDNSDVLSLLNLDNAKSVIVLDESENSTAQSLNTIAAVRKVSAIVNVVTGLEKSQISDTYQNVSCVDSEAVTSSLIAQAARADNLLNVFTDLLNFSGDEIYFANIPALAGKTYSDAILAFNFASVIGLVEGGVTTVNPAMNTILTKDTKIIAIAADATSVIYTGVREDIAQSEVIEKNRPNQAPANLLFIGWSALGKRALAQLDGYLATNSKIHIIARQEYVDQNELQNLKFENLEVKVYLLSSQEESEITIAQKLDFEKVVILGYRQQLSSVDADRKTEEVSEQLATLFASHPDKFGQVDVAFRDQVSEDLLPAMVMAQISQNPQLEAVFEDLFDAQGAHLNCRDVTDYASLGQKVSMAELAATARNYGESAIGYRLGKTGQIVLNPAKIWEVVPEQGHQLLVIGNK